MGGDNFHDIDGFPCSQVCAARAVRSETIQNDPIAISAMNRAELEHSHVYDVQDIAELATGVSIAGTGSRGYPVIRGIPTRTEMAASGAPPSAPSCTAIATSSSASSASPSTSAPRPDRQSKSSRGKTAQRFAGIEARDAPIVFTDFPNPKDAMKRCPNGIS